MEVQLLNRSQLWCQYNQTCWDQIKKDGWNQFHYDKDIQKCLISCEGFSRWSQFEMLGMKCFGILFLTLSSLLLSFKTRGVIFNISGLTLLCPHCSLLAAQNSLIGNLVPWLVGSLVPAFFVGKILKNTQNPKVDNCEKYQQDLKIRASQREDLFSVFRHASVSWTYPCKLVSQSHLIEKGNSTSHPLHSTPLLHFCIFAFFMRKA